MQTFSPVSGPGDATARLGKNIPLFIAFRTLFNARWYYPVLGVLFIDLGLTMEQYALLNVAWAVSIVCLEVPSGALADQIGRKRMVVLAAVFMVVEMMLFAFAPAGSLWLFPMLLLNRVLSGAAEASASGADESLAFDSLRELGREKEWPAVLSRTMRWQAAGFFVAMLLGAAVYDPKLMGAAFGCAGIHFQPAAAATLRWPLYLTLANAILALLVTLRMREPGTRNAAPTTLRSTIRQTLGAGGWILHTRTALFVILCGLCLDSVIRLYLTVNSNYFRLIGLPESSFGIVGSGFALLGFFVPPLAKWLAENRSLISNLLVTAALAFLGLLVSAFVWPIWGVLAVIPVGIAMSMLQFFLSHYLNLLVTDSSQRATVLSFKGLCFNLAYGAIGLLFAAFTRARHDSGSQDAIFVEALRCLPWFFAALVGLMLTVGRRIIRPSEPAR